MMVGECDERFISAAVVPIEMKASDERDHHIEQTLVPDGRVIFIAYICLIIRGEEGRWRQLLVISCNDDMSRPQDGRNGVLGQNLRCLVKDHKIEKTGSSVDGLANGERAGHPTRTHCGEDFTCFLEHATN